MPIDYDAQSLLVQFVWESANFASGGGTTTLAFNANFNGAAEAGLIVDGIVDAFNTTLRLEMDSDFTLATARWETETFSGDLPAGLVGGASITGPPINTSVLFSYSAAEKGPRNRGRSFWPGLLSETQVDERGVILPARVLQLQVELADFLNAAGAVPNNLGQSISQSSTPGQNTPPIHPWPIVNSVVVQPIAATQRRRMRP